MSKWVHVRKWGGGRRLPYIRNNPSSGGSRGSTPFAGGGTGVEEENQIELGGPLEGLRRRLLGRKEKWRTRTIHKSEQPERAKETQLLLRRKTNGGKRFLTTNFQERGDHSEVLSGHLKERGLKGARVT